MDWQYFSNDKIQNHLNELVQSPYTCYWHCKKSSNTLSIQLCVVVNFDYVSKLEFLFPLLNGIRYLNSNKIIFNYVRLLNTMYVQ